SRLGHPHRLLASDRNLRPGRRFCQRRAGDRHRRQQWPRDRAASALGAVGQRRAGRPDAVGSADVPAMIQRILRRSPSPAHKTPVPQAAIDACEDELRTYERRYAYNPPEIDWQMPGEVRRVETTDCGARLSCAHVTINLTWLSA